MNMHNSDQTPRSRKAVSSVLERNGEVYAVAITVPSHRVLSTNLPQPDLDAALKALKRNIKRRGYVLVPRQGGLPVEGRSLAEAVEKGQKIARKIHDFYVGKDVQFSEELDFSGMTEFIRSVLLTARSIPRGKVASYSWVAEKAGFPGACRAVGNAMATNPFSPIVPCHRVVRSNRETGNFGGGTSGRARKKRLLLMEGVEFERNENRVSTDSFLG